MSLVVRRGPESYFDDGFARAAMARYCVHRKLAYKLGDRYATIDMVSYRPGTDIYTGLELTCNACWTTQEEYPAPRIHIPKRKWATFYNQVHDVPDKNISRAKTAYLVVMNVPCTKAATLKFAALLDQPFEEEFMNINGREDLFVWVPISYIHRYIKIPPAPEEIGV